MLALHDIFLQAQSKPKRPNEAQSHCSSTKGCVQPLCLTVLAQLHDIMLAPNMFILK